MPSYICTYPDFDDDESVEAEQIVIEAASSPSAAERAAAWWEAHLSDFSVLHGREVLTVAVESAAGMELWWVMGEGGKYVAKEADA